MGLRQVKLLKFLPSRPLVKLSKARGNHKVFQQFAAKPRLKSGKSSERTPLLCAVGLSASAGVREALMRLIAMENQRPSTDSPFLQGR